MHTKQFTPNPKYLIKMRVVMAVIAGAVLLFGLLFGVLLSFDDDVRLSGGIIIILVTFGLDILWLVPALFLSGPYYRSLRYEIQDNEIVMYVGIWTKSVKHVPYRTVTNLTVKEGLLDRLFGLGTLDVQTAGMSGSTGEAEQSLVGLSNAQEVYEMVAAVLRQFRAGMAPTAADSDEVMLGDETLAAILSEVRAIRQAMDKAT